MKKRIKVTLRYHLLPVCLTRNKITSLDDMGVGEKAISYISDGNMKIAC